MKYFADRIIHPFIANRHYQTFCEIGASYGENTDRILESPSVRITIVDPCLDADLEAKYAGRENVKVRKGLSLDVLKDTTGHFDCILIDGDHNWYTVFNELDLIARRQLLKPGGTIFLHDVGWPYGRRDMYYQPETIPAEFVHPNAEKGMVQGQSLLADTGGVNSVRKNALHSGGPRNGVLTAVEDFLAGHPGEYWFTMDREQNGLGILMRRKALLGDAAFGHLWVRILLRRLRVFWRENKKKIATVVLGLVVASIIPPLINRLGKRR